MTLWESVQRGRYVWISPPVIPHHSILTPQCKSTAHTHHPHNCHNRCAYHPPYLSASPQPNNSSIVDIDPCRRSWNPGQFCLQYLSCFKATALRSSGKVMT